MVEEKLREWRLFATEALRARNVCSIVPSSLATVRKVCREIPTDRAIVLAEYGPGTGVFTKYLANRLHPGSCILAIERSRDFYLELCRWRGMAAPKCRILLEHADCRDVREIARRHELPPFDYVLSGIPFSMLSEQDRDWILKATYESLGPEGTLLVYQTTSRLRPRLDQLFDCVEEEWNWFNLPPLAILRARKRCRVHPSGQERKQETLWTR